MELSKIKVGMTVNYKARVHKGRGKVVEKVTKANGPWIKVRPAAGVFVQLRPSQIIG